LKAVANTAEITLYIVVRVHRAAPLQKSVLQ